MKLLSLTVSTPDGDAFAGEVMALTLRGSDGDLAVLPGHIPFITTVKAGKVALHMEDGSCRHGITDGGLLTVTGQRTTLLSGSFKWSEE